ncbi:MAG: DUF3575 domain-containing protein [Bacteroidales bacterium]
MKTILILCLLFLAIPLKGDGQNFSISTNFLEYFNLGTINGEFGLSITPKWSVYLQGRYNPFTFKRNGVMSNGYKNQMQNRQLSAAIGAKYWLWYTNSGWFISSQLSYTKYNRGGIIKDDTYQGDAYGITMGAGYSLMLGKHLNIDFGIGIMGGYTSYIKYLCPRCGTIVKEDKKIYVAPNNLLVQLSYLF